MMAQESQKKVCDDNDSMLTWLSELCRSAISVFNSGGTMASTSSPTTINSTHGKKLNEAVYLFHKPQDRVDIEIVFIHGLEFDGSKEGYWKTWLVGDGTQDNCWPETWLVEEFPQARILSLSYDASIEQTLTAGRMDPYSLGESLVQQMTFGDIGQHDCPVVFVCHSFGGLVAKQIVVIGSQKFQDDKRVQNLLRNLRAFHFYATPHVGVQVDVLPMNPSTSKGPCVSYLEVFCPEVGRLNFDFEQIRKKDSNGWICYNVGEMHATSHGRLVVPEASARQEGHGFLAVSAGHFDICKPQNKENSSYLSLTTRISEVIKVHEKEQQLRLLELPKKLVGMDDMQSMICEKLCSVSIIGLVGMGGIGKTTISKSVFNSQAKSYDKTCFLQDVRPDNLASAKRQLFKEICREKEDSTICVSDVELDRIQQCIMGNRVLLVIDDVKNSTTLKALQVPKFQRSLSSGSRVIVTCRNRQVLDDHIVMEGLKDVEIIDVEHLNDANALELFRYHAFHGIEGGDDEMKDFEVLSVNVAKACCGLPLSLEVIGQHLQKQHRYSIGKRKEIWEEALKKLRAARSFDGGDENEVLWKRLMISYDNLDNDHKRMFLDFACFFCENSCALSGQSIGWIWGSCRGLEILRERSLIKVGEFNEWRHSYTIHDQLRDMGRRIVKDLSLKRSRESLRKVTRLWEVDDIERFLEDDKGSRTIEGISFEECRSRLVALPSQAYPNVKGEMTIQRFDSLRLLNLRKCRIEVVDFFLRKCWKELSWLSLHMIKDMVIPQSIEAIGLCTGLRVLQVGGCSNLEELPASIGRLVHLKELDLSFCKNLRSLPHEIGCLKQLRRLELLNCKTLKEVPSCISQLTNLEYFGLVDCCGLVSMVEFERQMDHLIELDLGNCHNLRLPFKSLGKLHKLQTLNMSSCENLVIENPSKSFRQLSRLAKLNLYGCKNFIPGLCLDYFIGELAAEKVERLWNPVVKNFSSRLQELQLPSISTIGFPLYPNLKVLTIHNRFHLEELPECLGDVTQLQKLTVWDTFPYCLKKLPTSLSRLVKLERLNLYSMVELEGLPNIFGQLCSLKNLTIHNMRKVEELPSSLGQLIQLEHLKLGVCVNLKRLPGSFTSLTRLSVLDLMACDAFEEMDEGQKLFLQQLKQRGCHIFLRRLGKDSAKDDNEDTLSSEL